VPEVPECTFYIFTQPRAAKQTGPTEPTPKYVSKRPSLEAFLPNFIRISSEFHPNFIRSLWSDVKFSVRNRTDAVATI
jgi:hypothetical protein